MARRLFLGLIAAVILAGIVGGIVAIMVIPSGPETPIDDHAAAEAAPETAAPGTTAAPEPEPKASAAADMGAGTPDASVFGKCRACHSVRSPGGEVIVQGGRVGPDLYGVAGRTAGTEKGYRYSSSMKAAGKAGLVWNRQNFVEYLHGPSAFLKEYLNDPSARAKMTFRLRKGGGEIFDYLASVGP